jgi:hypothetical protein
MTDCGAGRLKRRTMMINRLLTFYQSSPGEQDWKKGQL